MNRGYPAAKIDRLFIGKITICLGERGYPAVEKTLLAELRENIFLDFRFQGYPSIRTLEYSLEVRVW